MFRGLAPWMQALPGRLLHVNVAGCAIFAAVSGSSAATCATIGKMSLPELAKRGYPDGIAIGSLAGAGTLGLLIPPSIIMIVYGVIADVSIAQLFIAGVLPGILLALLFSGYLVVWALLQPAAGAAARCADELGRQAARIAPPDPGDAAHRLRARLDLQRHRHRHRSRGAGRGRRAAHLGGAGLAELADLPRFAARRHAAVLHDRDDPGRRRLPDAGHGLHRPAAAPGRMDRHAGPEPVRPDRSC